MRRLVAGTSCWRGVQRAGSTILWRAAFVGIPRQAFCAARWQAPLAGVMPSEPNLPFCGRRFSSGLFLALFLPLGGGNLLLRYAGRVEFSSLRREVLIGVPRQAFYASRWQASLAKVVPSGPNQPSYGGKLLLRPLAALSVPPCGGNLSLEPCQVSLTRHLVAESSWPRGRSTPVRRRAHSFGVSVGNKPLVQGCTNGGLRAPPGGRMIGVVESTRLY